MTFQLPFVPRSTYDLVVAEAKAANDRAAAADERARLAAAETRLAVRDALDAVRQAMALARSVGTTAPPAEDLDGELPKPSSVGANDRKRGREAREREEREDRR